MAWKTVWNMSQNPKCGVLLGCYRCVVVLGRLPGGEGGSGLRLYQYPSTSHPSLYFPWGVTRRPG